MMERTSSVGSIQWIDAVWRYAFYDESNTYIPNSGGQNENWGKTRIAEKFAIPEGARYMAVALSALVTVGTTKYYFTTTDLSQSEWGDYGYEPYREDDIQIVDLDWYGKTLLTYGDSITAIGNGDSNCVGWQKRVCDYFGIPTHYGRGIGSSTMAWRADCETWYSNPDGSYNSRGTTKPDGEEGVDYFTHDPLNNKPSSFCAWDRITTMYSDAIKDDIDLIICMGGTNDHIYSTPIGDSLEFSSANTQDAIWIASEDYTGGDYDTTTFKGAVASTIMKIQKRCPNAKLVMCTQLSGYGTDKNPNKNRLGLIPMDYVKAFEEVCEYMSVPCIDVFGTNGINQLNYNGKITDGTHPYSIDGCRLLGTAIVVVLKSIVPTID